MINQTKSRFLYLRMIMVFVCHSSALIKLESLAALTLGRLDLSSFGLGLGLVGSSE